MKLTGLSILLVSFVLLFTGSVQAQEDKTAKTDKQKIGKKKTAGKESEKKANKSNREYLVGAKGGCYYLNASGKKTYVDKENCRELSGSTTEKMSATTERTTSDAKTEIKTIEVESTDTKPVSEGEDKTTDEKTTIVIDPKTEKREKAKTEKKIDSSGRTYTKGSRGGCYYMNGDRKVYVKDKSLCEN